MRQPLMTASFGLHVDRVPHAAWSSSALISVQTNFMRVKIGFADPIKCVNRVDFRLQQPLIILVHPPYGVGV